MLQLNPQHLSKYPKSAFNQSLLRTRIANNIMNTDRLVCVYICRKALKYMDILKIMLG